MKYNSIIPELAAAVDSAKGGTGDYIDFYGNEDGMSGSNQMLLFMKPELSEPGVKFDAVARFILKKIEQYDFAIENAFVLSGGYLGRNGIIAAHYGIINAAAHKPVEIMSEGMWKSFERAFDCERRDANLIGAADYLANHAEISADELSSSWLEGRYEKLGSGVYCQYRAEDDVYLVNGFYPRLLNRFTTAGTCIACFILRGTTSWRSARNDFTGATAPEKAKAGSIRNELLSRKGEFGLAEISPNLNGVHLSAGPVEGVVEILRFSAKHKNLSDLVFGKMLLDNFEKSRIDTILANGTVETESGKTTYFDLTEEVDSGDAIQIIGKTAGR